MAGGLISYGPDFYEHRRAAGYVDRILKGGRRLTCRCRRRRSRVGDQPQDREGLGLEVPLSLLARADEVIE